LEKAAVKLSRVEEKGLSFPAHAALGSKKNI